MAFASVLSFLVAAVAVQPGPTDLAVHVNGRWVSWWSEANAPARWVAPSPVISSALRWQQLAEGLNTAELELRVSSLMRPAKVVVVRIDPRAFRFHLEAAVSTDGSAAAWSVAATQPDITLAVSAGKFVGVAPWGWVVHGGREASAPVASANSSAVVFEKSGAFTLVNAAEINAVRNAGFAYEAFQSSPTLLSGDGDVPKQLTDERNDQLAIGETRDGEMLILLTHLSLSDRETAALMGALGARRAVALDGGRASQLLVRSDDGRVQTWRGQRKVPMGLVAVRAREKTMTTNQGR